MKKTIKNKLAISEVTDTIYFGDIVDGKWKNRKEISENDFLTAMISYIQKNNGEILVTEDGRNKWLIKLEDIIENGQL
ncbi:MAG: DUF7446 family protein [Cetobacterium sp.]|uniref:DUF7446 family protein n=1 Tax=Cetobacterium sp. TaxID=2071632 RepID=UPI003F2D755F